ncbi:MAG: VCBS repeat-containing protein [Myxococcales bacterium]|nr:VCBS repeat-containing protein [Myxococcales bacterium]
MTATMTAGVPTTGDDGSASDSLTGTTAVSGVSESATVASTPSEPTTDVSASATDTDATAGTTDNTSGGPPPFCSEEPPAGYVGPFDASCKTEPQIGTFTPVAEWSKSSWAAAPAYDQAMVAPIVAPITDDDGDGVYGSPGDMPSILMVTYAGAAYQSDGVLRAISGDGALEQLAIPGVAACSGLAAGDIDGDGIVELVAVDPAGAVVAFEHDGAAKWTSAAYPADLAYAFMSVPSIADMDGDGSPEIIVGRVILNSDGSLRGKGLHGTGAPTYGSTSFAVDTDNDGVQEVVVGNALYRPDGSDIWYNQMADGYPAVADFDGDGGPEIVVVGAGTVRLQTAGGGVLWDVANPAQVGGPPTIADYDGDGKPEIGVAGKVGYVVFDTDGSVLWQQATQDASSAVTGSSVYDFEGDGVADVVYADEVNLYIYSGTDGSVKLTYDGHNSGTLIEYPIVVDVDNDGQVEIVVTHNNLIQTAHGVTVVGDMDQSWRPGRKIWNQHAYNITNSIRVS